MYQQQLNEVSQNKNRYQAQERVLENQMQQLEQETQTQQMLSNDIVTQ